MFDKDKKMLTEKNGLGEYELKVCQSCHPGENNEQCGLCSFMQDAVERLGEYEDSGLTPKEVAKLKKASDKGKVKTEGTVSLPVFDMADPDCGKKIEAWGEQNDDKD